MRLAWVIAAAWCVACSKEPARTADSPAPAVAQAAALVPSAPAAGSPVALQAELERLRAENVALRTELANEQSRRQQREQEWLEYTRALAELAPKAGVSPPSFATDVGTAEMPPVALTAPPDPAIAARAERDAQILRRMQALLIADSVQGLDALELGTLQDGFTGPVVFRALDDEGRPVGSICAEKLELEGSRAARTLTFVFSQGYHRRGELRTPFPGTGVLRVELPEVDPTPWIESLPELFAKARPRERVDDALHDLTKLRVALNLQLREDAAAGYWRLASLEGVMGGTLREVVLDGFSSEGQLERKLFADTLRILERPQGVLLLLESGAQLRGDIKTPFLEGRYRIHLPRLDCARLRAAGVPVLEADG
ncbi:MAG: hypothetical protein RL277_2749 [Planctomycetota bacterium]|jgi:hypothetical protein